MYTAEIITSRTNGGVALESLLMAGDSIVDVSHHPAHTKPDPNSVVWSAVISAETLAAVDADADHYILWSDEVTDEVTNG